MATNDFSSSISAKVSLSEAIIKISNITEWWGVTVIGSAKKQNDKFLVKMGGDSFFDFTVSELIPRKRIVWLVTGCYMPWYADKKEWANTKLIFDLDEKNSITELIFKHEGLTPNLECYKDCERGWTQWIKISLLSYLTNGLGIFDQSCG